jgi:hypothetical protein
LSIIANGERYAVLYGFLVSSKSKEIWTATGEEEGFQDEIRRYPQRSSMLHQRAVASESDRQT